MLTTDRRSQNCGQQYLPKGNNRETISPNQQIFPLTATVNSRDCLEIGGCELTTLVAQFGSPLYVLDEHTLRTACRQYREAFRKYYPGQTQVIFASKAWSCLAVCAIVAFEDLGFDVVSGGELYTTLYALEQIGRSELVTQKVYFHGNNKSLGELELAIAAGCTIIVDNWWELETLAKLGASRGGQSVRMMIRLTPGIECHTHEYIKTGHIDSKFGFDPHQLEAVLTYIVQNPVLKCIGLHAHIGSQIFERQPHQDLGGVLVEWMGKAIALGLNIEELNVGGGLGICYTETDDPPSIEEWAKTVAESVASACESHQLPLPKLIAEPGRSLIGSACVTAYTVGARKEIPNVRTYIAVDGGMSDNPRPITYQSLYRAVIANRMSVTADTMVTVAGKHCESGDILIQEAQLPKTETGDILVVPATGAYNYSMASNYNRLPRPAAVVVNNGEANLILQRETYEDLIRQDRLPGRLLP